MPIEYVNTVQFAGDAKRAMGVAQTTLVAQNFQITSSGELELQFIGPGISSTRENPLKAMTEGAFVIHDGAIHVKARLGGAEWMVKFLRIFPILLAVFFLTLWGVLAFFIPVFRLWWIFALPILVMSPWLVLAPMIGRSIQARTKNAIDALVSNMALIGTSD